MKEPGFLPFTAVGLILLMLAVSLTGYYQWKEHQVEMKSIHKSSSSSLLTAIAGKRNEVRRQARESLYDALWKVGKNADGYENKQGRKKGMEDLARLNFERRLSLLNPSAGDRSLHLHLVLENKDSEFELKRADGGYVLGEVGFPEGAFISGTLPDKSLSISLPGGSFQIPTDVRFFLLQNLVDGFGDELGEIEKRWKYAEYAIAYAQTWGAGDLNLSEDRSRTLFHLALSTYEIDKFGSTDYLATLEDLIGRRDVQEAVNHLDSDPMVDFLKPESVRNLTGKVSDSITQIRESADELRSAVSEIKEVERFNSEAWFENQRRKFSELERKVGHADSRDLIREFGGVCEDFRGVYKFPELQIGRTLRKIRKAEGLVDGSWSQFKNGLRSIEELSEENPLMERLYEDFTREGKRPGIATQLKTCVEGVLENLVSVEEEVRQAKEPLQLPPDIVERFPGNFEERFEDALREDNRELARRILSRASASSDRAFNEFKNAMDDRRTEIDLVHSRLSEVTRSQTEEPEANWRDTYLEYPGPDDSLEEKPAERVVEKFVIYPDSGTIGGMEKVLRNARTHLGLLESLVRKLGVRRGELEEFDMGDGLKQYLKEGIKYQIPENLTREEFYEICPPRPLKPEPGLSVYHEVEVGDVEFNREDPMGLIEDSAPPTPIYLWFIDVFLYWAQWEVKIELEGPLVEEVFDYRNQTLPRPMVEGSKTYVHKPLPYRREFRKPEFSFRLIVISLRNFRISYD